LLYWFLKMFIVGPILKLLYRPWVEGGENVPQSGPAILASNHLSFSDSVFLPVVLTRRITFPAKMEYFTTPGLKGRLTRWFFKGIGQIPIDRSGGEASEAAIQSGLKVLRRGELFGIYPEGTRSPDGRLFKGKTGIARMALEAGCPVVPVAMIGTDKAQPTGQKVPNIMRIGIRIGQPLDFSRYEGMENDRFVLRSITDEIMYELMLLSGQEYVDVYATSLKKNVVAHTVQTAQLTVQQTMQSALAKAREIQVAAAKTLGSDSESSGTGAAVLDAAASDSAATDAGVPDPAAPDPAAPDPAAPDSAGAHGAGSAAPRQAPDVEHLGDATDRPGDTERRAS
jgi:1-acyl-sn-glycerol-3-phosphate acyltransferase